MGILSKAAKGLYSLGAQRKLKSKKASTPRTKPKSDKQNIQMHGASTKVRQQRKVKEAQKLAKGADRGKKTEQVAKRVLPDVGSRVRKELQGMSAADIAEEYSGKEITAMIRKVKNPTVLARLQKAKRSREKKAATFIKENQGPRSKGFLRSKTPLNIPSKMPKTGTRGAQLKAKQLRKGGTAKRKSGGKMSTDGSSFVASLYKGGKVGG